MPTDKQANNVTTDRQQATERDLTYTLPPLVESVRASWITTFQSAAVVLGASVAINDDHDSFANSRESLRSFLYIASFGAIIFNISATMTSLVLIERLCGLEWTAAGISDAPKEGTLSMDGIELLSRFGCIQYGHILSGILNICRLGLLSLILGMWCMLLEIIVFVWVSQKTTTAVKATMTCAMSRHFERKSSNRGQSTINSTALAIVVAAASPRTSEIESESERTFVGCSGVTNRALRTRSRYCGGDR
ncbi:hypothetical protein BDZ89DRAFT_1033668 [Hymenopellis radicata]|nr:hypothetical protein BDZ89DRAFT_1033668 [Hymenopellis radicata]